jgi:hypothetical protein
MRRFLIAIWLALASSVALAQEVTLPQTVIVSAGRLAAIEITYDGDDFQYYVAPELDAFREYTTDSKTVKLRVIGYTNGTFPVTAVAAKAVNGKGKLSPVKTCLVHVGGTPPVPPGPGPSPIPPGPGPSPIPPRPEPTPPDPIKGPRHLVILHESADRTPQLANLRTALRVGPSAQHLLDNGHRLDFLDDEHASQEWLKHIEGLKLPALFIMNEQHKVLYKGSLKDGETEAGILEILKQHGG